MVSSRRANTAVRSTIRSEKDHGSMARVTLDSCCGFFFFLGGGDLDRLANMQSCIPMEKKGNRFLICRGRNQCSGKQWESDMDFLFKNSSFLSFSSLIATKQSSTAPSSSPPLMATAQCCSSSQQEQLSSGPQAVPGSRYCDADADAVPLELTAVRRDPMEKSKPAACPPSKESPTQRPIHRFVAVLFGYRTLGSHHHHL